MTMYGILDVIFYSLISSQQTIFEYSITNFNAQNITFFSPTVNVNKKLRISKYNRKHALNRKEITNVLFELKRSFRNLNQHYHQ